MADEIYFYFSCGRIELPCLLPQRSCSSKVVYGDPVAQEVELAQTGLSVLESGD